MSNREIKFRAWDIRFKKMVATGFHVIGEVTMFNMIEGYCYETLNEGESVLTRLNDIEVTECVGIKDRDEKDIYEGDFVECNRYEHGDNFLVQVKDIRHLPSEMFGSNLNFRLVVGNIYENPELLNP
jgi:uncharacterized phage protein (TIGR01671 family)